MPLDPYYDQAELREIDSGKFHGGAFFLPLLASALAPVIAKVITGKGASTKKIQKHLVGSGLFRELAKSILKSVLKKGVDVAREKALEKSQEYISKGADYATARIDAGCDEPSGVCGGKKEEPVKKEKRKNVSGNCGTRENRNLLVKKIMREQKLSLPAASKYIKDHSIPY